MIVEELHHNGIIGKTKQTKIRFELMIFRIVIENDRFIERKQLRETEGLRAVDLLIGKNDGHALASFGGLETLASLRKVAQSSDHHETKGHAVTSEYLGE